MLDFNSAERFVCDLLTSHLPKGLSYHDVGHTMDVVNVSRALCEHYQLSSHDTLLVTIAALFHDTGFIHTYDGHEAKSVEIMKNYFKDTIDRSDLERMAGMIMATKVPQDPTGLLESILADADLDYLGRADFYANDAKLYAELDKWNKISSKNDWLIEQIEFLEDHQYHTDRSRDLRGQHKAERIMELKHQLSIQVGSK